jgi:hypothetical protein
MSKDTSGSAFPVERATIAEQYGSPGLTKREWFAGMAMQGYLSRNEICISDDEPFDATVSKWAFEMADAMIAEGSK